LTQIDIAFDHHAIDRRVDVRVRQILSRPFKRDLR
jgi:hypothetical protein